MRYFSDRNIQKRFSQHLSVEDKPSPSCPQHSLGFSFVSGREYSGHQKAQPLLEHIYLGIVEQYVLQVSLFFPILPPVNLCVSSSEFSGIWAPGIQNDPAWASGHFPGSWGCSGTGQSGLAQLPDTAAGSSLNCSSSRLTSVQVFSLLLLSPSSTSYKWMFVYSSRRNTFHSFIKINDVSLPLR